MLLLIVMILVLVLGLAVQTALTHGAALLVRVENATWRRACVVVLAITAWSVLTLVIGNYVGRAETNMLAGALMMLVLTVSGMLVIYSRIYRTTGRQLLGFVALQAILVGVSYGFAFMLKNFVGEAFVIPTNGMAPTILGRHATGICPKCGGQVIHSFVELPPHLPAWADQRIEPAADGICGECWENFVGQKFPPAVEPIAGDRIMVDKLSDFKRWDAIVFYVPHEDRVLYVQRLVGLPGEEIVIGDDGLLLIDGRRVEPPAHLVKLRYSSRPDEHNPEFFSDYDKNPLDGDPRKPLKLGADEYFVLGDNTHRSLDSRFWGAVKRDAIVAPVSLIYWPPERWRVFK